MINKSMFLLTFVFISILSVCWSVDERMQAGISTGFIYGSTLYQIGDYVKSGGGASDIPFEISQLKFNIADPVVSLNLKYSNLLPDWDLELNLQKSIPVLTGKLYDSDWGIWYLNGYTWANNNTLDVFSYSDTKEDILIFNSSLSRHFWHGNNMELLFAAGFDFKSFAFEAKNLVQWYPSYEQYKNYLPVEYSQNITSDAVGIQYHMYEYIFPLMNYFTFNIYQLQVKIGAGVLPGFFTDTDDHLLRSKKSTCQGLLMGGRGQLNAGYEITPGLTIGADCTYDYVTGSGEQNQVRYKDTTEGKAGSLGSIGERMETVTISGGLSAGYKF